MLCFEHLLHVFILCKDPSILVFFFFFKAYEGLDLVSSLSLILYGINFLGFCLRNLDQQNGFLLFLLFCLFFSPKLYSYWFNVALKIELATFRMPPALSISSTFPRPPLLWWFWPSKSHHLLSLSWSTLRGTSEPLYQPDEQLLKAYGLFLY